MFSHIKRDRIDMAFSRVFLYCVSTVLVLEKEIEFSCFFHICDFLISVIWKIFELMVFQGKKKKPEPGKTELRRRGASP